MADLDKLYAVIKREKGHLDIVFANAGGGTFVPLAAVTEEHFDQTFNINVKGLLFTVQKALPLLKDDSSIVLNASIAGIETFPPFSASVAPGDRVGVVARPGIGAEVRPTHGP